MSGIGANRLYWPITVLVQVDEVKIGSCKLGGVYLASRHLLSVDELNSYTDTLSKFKIGEENSSFSVHVLHKTSPSSVVQWTSKKCTVKLLYNARSPWGRKKVAVVERWPFWRGRGIIRHFFYRVQHIFCAKFMLTVPHNHGNPMIYNE